ncbi:hypothetical protein [Paenibacillus hexagrammi]|uniref:Uncharacterized protein n=1 Tax=Paenibacillus hexagrammi TaxID=2908839 RepID=A0ABY3SCJ6_9BACL|nr:hypothetical protein [Paenibacillus sp. YPD9-1]UJF31517.1 hypothetical protein L0M14_17055 [Paenibacillus sp. YPD9-1]
MKWLIWTTACLIGIGGLLQAPVRSSATDDASRTSLIQSSKYTEEQAPRVLVNEINEASIPSDPANRAEADPEQNSAGMQENNPAVSSEAAFTNTVNKWQMELSKEQGFESWKDAAWKQYPLGPGTHGWVVILNSGQQEVGYMVISAAENGSLQLTEYGSGDQPLFSLNTLYRTLIQQELIPPTISFMQFSESGMITKERLYMDGFTSVWKVQLPDQTYYVDAKTGELLPIHEDPASSSLAAELRTGTSLNGSIQERRVPSFDPYENMSWIVGEPLAITELKDLQNQLDQQSKLTYVAELYDHQVTIPLAVLGYRQWDSEEPYLIVDQEGPRFILLHNAVRQGHISLSSI